MANKTVFITGISGQDGAYLSRFLLEKGYRVIGGNRRTASGSLWRLEELGVSNDVEIVNFELAELTNIQRVLEKYPIDELYNLAAQSFVEASFEVPIMTSDITGVGVVRILESIRNLNPQIKFYQASSSEMFGKTQQISQNEKTPFYPCSPYGISKLFGHWMTVTYREAYNLHTCSGICFNHESPLRGHEFVTRKITIAFSRIKCGEQQLLELGNLEAKRDWGFAGDYVEGMWKMLQQDVPDDYVLATGEIHSVRDFINEVAPYFHFRIEWTGSGTELKAIDKNSNKTIIRVNPKYYRSTDIEELKGDSNKAIEKLGWKPKVGFKDLARMMAEADLRRYCRKKP